MTRLTKFIAAGVAASTLAACNMTSDQATVVGAAGGAASGLILAEALDANSNWRIISALGGAAAGTMVAHNARTDRCAYARGDGTYVSRPCNY